MSIISRLIQISLRIAVIIIISLIMIEAVAQLAFDMLPQALKQQMPHAPIRYGINFDTPHGAREYPAGEDVNLSITQYSGDLYSISCLSPADAPEFEPYTVRYKRDEHGFRNPTSWAETIDLVIVGDSFTAAESIQKPYWADITSNQLVMGLPGSGSLEQSLLLDAYGTSRKPEATVLAYFGGNDIRDSKRFYEAKQQGETLYSITNKDRQPWEYLITFQTVMLLRNTFSRADASNDCPYPLLDSMNTPLAFFDDFLIDSTRSIEEIRSSPDFKITQDAIISIAQNARTNDSVFTLMYIPHKAQVHWELLSDSQQMTIAAHIEIMFSETDASGTLDRLNKNIDAQREILSEIARSNDFLFLDLTPEFQQAAHNGAQNYFFSDTHWNQSGHDLARKLLSDFLYQHMLIAQP